jgi:hypothetical protein
LADMRLLQENFGHGVAPSVPARAPAAPAAEISQTAVDPVPRSSARRRLPAQRHVADSIRATAADQVLAWPLSDAVPLSATRRPRKLAQSRVVPRPLEPSPVDQVSQSPADSTAPRQR